MTAESAPSRILATPLAEEWIGKLAAIHGPLMFHQSGGCCDGSAPMCFVAGEFRVGGQDVLLGHVAEGTPVWIGAAQFEYWRHTQLIIDVVPGRGGMFSLDNGREQRLLTRGRVFSSQELQALKAAAPPPTGTARGG